MCNIYWVHQWTYLENIAMRQLPKPLLQRRCFPLIITLMVMRYFVWCSIYLFVHESRAPVAWSSKPHMYALRTYFFLVNIENQLRLLWFSIALLCDWPKKLAPLFQLIRGKTKTNRDVHARALSRAWRRLDKTSETINFRQLLLDEKYHVVHLVAQNWGTLEAENCRVIWYLFTR